MERLAVNNYMLNQHQDYDLLDTTMEEIQRFQQDFDDIASTSASATALTSTTAATGRTRTNAVCILHRGNERTAQKLRAELGQNSICTEVELSNICFQEHVSFKAVYLIVDSRMADKFQKERVFDALIWLDSFSDLGKPIYVIDDIKDERKFNTTFYRLPESARKYHWQTGNNTLINTVVQIGLENECTLQMDDLGCNLITQIGESTNITNIHIGDITSGNTAKITITSIGQDPDTERRLFKVFKDNQCIINSYLPLQGALVTSVEEGSIILNLKLDSNINVQEFLHHRLQEILTCLLNKDLLTIVKDQLRLHIHVESQLSVDVQDVMSGHTGQPAAINPKTFTEKEIQTKLTWVKSNPKVIDITSPCTSTTFPSPEMSTKDISRAKPMDVTSTSKIASLSRTPSKSDDDTAKILTSPKHRTQTTLDNYVGNSPLRSSSQSDLDLGQKKSTMFPPSTSGFSLEKGTVSSAKDNPQAAKRTKKIKACHKLFKGQLPYFERPQTKTSGYFKIANIHDFKESVQFLPFYVGKSDDIGGRLDQLFKSQPDTVPSSTSPSSIEAHLASLKPEEYDKISVFWVDRTKDKHQCKGCSMLDCLIRESGAPPDIIDKDEEWSEGEETEEKNTARKVIFPGTKFSSSHTKHGSSPALKVVKTPRQYRPVARTKKDVKHPESAFRIMAPEFIPGSECSPRSTSSGYKTSDSRTAYSEKRIPCDTNPTDVPLKLKKPKIEREWSP
ncbi:uncharacterized protein LOC124138773 isoform X1 [Haliotis rufescens]|uniref:uncharacterized protein LOC124138773 isoform X1 n=2 Tax=Haliotis rufescens TaxID=6454 RepID=UPI00201EA68A|nr:uncharacterized protein LOC124138773 isoform X1 [Haliotis rufescens]